MAPLQPCCWCMLLACTLLACSAFYTHACHPPACLPTTLHCALPGRPCSLHQPGGGHAAAGPGGDGCEGAGAPGALLQHESRFAAVTASWQWRPEPVVACYYNFGLAALCMLVAAVQACVACIQRHGRVCIVTYSCRRSKSTLVTGWRWRGTTSWCRCRAPTSCCSPLPGTLATAATPLRA